MPKTIITVEQASTILNKAVPGFIGSDVIVQADMTNLADVGKPYSKLTEGSKKAFQADLVALITDQIFVTKEFVSDTIDIRKGFNTVDGNGGIIQKTRMLPLEAVDDPSYDPAPGSTNDPFVNYGIEAEVTYFSNKEAFMVPVTIPDNWFTGMFLSIDKFMSMINMIESEVSKCVKMRLEILTKSVINTAAAAVISKGRSTQIVPLVTLFNTRFGTTLTAAQAPTDPEFGRFAALEMDNAVDLLRDYNTLTNIMEYPQSTSKDSVHFLINSQFVNAIHKYVYTDAYNLSYVKLPNFHKVFKWMGTSKTASITDTTTINIKATVPWSEEPIVVNKSGIVAMVFNPDMVGLYDLKQVTESQRDPVGLKTNAFTHVSASTMVDPYEDMIVFTLD